jgi:hypothetical protein
MPPGKLGYYMRFFLTDGDIALDTLEAALRSVDPVYSISKTDCYGRTDICGDLAYGGDAYGEIEINYPGDDVFKTELAELKDAVHKADGSQRQRVLDTLESAVAAVVVRVLWGGHVAEETLQRLDPLWKWLLANRQGLLQADAEGYYDATGLILEVD